VNLFLTSTAHRQVDKMHLTVRLTNTTLVIILHHNSAARVGESHDL